MHDVHDVGEAMDIVMRDSIDHLPLQRFSRSGEVRKEAAKDRKATRSRPVVSTTLYQEFQLQLRRWTYMKFLTAVANSSGAGAVSGSKE